MKHLFACALLLLGIACKSPNGAHGSNTQAVAAKLQGSAEFLQSGQNNTWQPVRLGQAFREGDQARTGADGQLDISLTPYGGVMTLMQNSAIQFERLGPDNTNKQAVAVLRLTRGRVVGDTLKLPKDSKVVVKTNAGTFAIP
jgi:hypothetical protein